MNVEELKPGVTRVSASPTSPRPYVGICGAMHGNEPCGAEAIQRLLEAFRAGHLTPAGGTLFLIHANLEASAQRRRHTQGGADLNRLWDFGFAQTLREQAWAYEHRRALELKELLGDLDVFLDLHSAATATPPFGISNGEPPIDEIAKRIGISYLVESWYGLADKVVIGFLKTCGVPALSVECGSHDEPNISETAFEIAMSFLRATGVIDDGRTLVDTPVQTVQVVERITKPSGDFAFGSPWKGFQLLEPGALVGRDRVTEIRVQRRCYAVLPNEKVDIGDDVIYLAVEAR